MEAKEGIMAMPLAHEPFVDSLSIARDARSAVMRIVGGFGGDQDVRDQLRRAALVAWVQTQEALESVGAERHARFRVAGEQASEAASIIEGALSRGIIEATDAEPALERLYRLTATLASLSRTRPR
jgi:hypothetical protein